MSRNTNHVVKFGILATLVAFTVSPCLAGQVACVAKNTAKILDTPNENGKVIRTITKQDGYIMTPNGITWLPVKGWYGVDTFTRPDPKQPGLMDSDVSGYVKADAVHCQLGGAG